MIVVTGGAGLIGSNLVKALNERGRDDILVVDDLTDGRKFANLVDCAFADLIDKDEFEAGLLAGDAQPEIEVVFHQGACSNTMEWDGRFMLRENYTYSKHLLGWCDEARVPLVYASSAAIYGTSTEFRETRECERPANVYGYSKLLFDRWVEAGSWRCPVVGLRYFNVYGPRESHKGEMASVAFKHHTQLQRGDTVELFVGSDGYGDGEQLRDFIFVSDVTAVNLWCWDHPDATGVFNVGTGRAQTFNDVARAVIEQCGRGQIRYVPFPERLVGHYQSYTQADVTRLRAAGYDAPFLTVEEGVSRYMKWLGA